MPVPHEAASFSTIVLANKLNERPPSDCDCIITFVKRLKIFHLHSYNCRNSLLMSFPKPNKKALVLKPKKLQTSTKCNFVKIKHKLIRHLHLKIIVSISTLHAFGKLGQVVLLQSVASTPRSIGKVQEHKLVIYACTRQLFYPAAVGSIF